MCAVTTHASKIHCAHAYPTADAAPYSAKARCARLLFSTKRCWRRRRNDRSAYRSHISSTKQKALQRAIMSHMTTSRQDPAMELIGNTTISATRLPNVQPVIVATVERRNRPNRYEARI